MLKHSSGFESTTWRCKLLSSMVYGVYLTFHRCGPRRTHVFLSIRYPVVLDAAIQSLGYGFVGTDRSTFSVLSKRRVQDWRDGATRMVRWGKKDADAH